MSSCLAFQVGEQCLRNREFTLGEYKTNAISFNKSEIVAPHSLRSNHHIPGLSQAVNSNGLKLMRKQTNIPGLCLHIFSSENRPIQILTQEKGFFRQVPTNDIFGIPTNKTLPIDIFNNYYVRLTEFNGQKRVQFRLRLRGGSKIPVFDELVRGVSSLANLVTGDTDRAAQNWENWTNDSWIANCGKTLGKPFQCAYYQLKGQKQTVRQIDNQLGQSVSRLGAMTMTSGYQAAGLFFRGLTLSIPNPLSGACQESAQKGNAVIDKNISQNKSVNWDELASQGVKGLASGAASCGGMIPYMKTIVENKIDSKQAEMDHAAQWANWGCQVSGTVVCKGVLGKIGSLSTAGKLGFKGAIGIGAGSGFVLGTTKALILQSIHQKSTKEKLQKEGFQLKRNEVNTRNGKTYAVYQKPGNQPIFVPCGSIRDAISAGVIEGIFMAWSAGKQQIKNQPKKATAEKRVSRLKNTNKRPKRRPKTGDKTRPSRKDSLQYTRDNMAEELNMKNGWVQVCSDEDTQMQYMYKIQNGQVHLRFVQHAGPCGYGPFRTEELGKFTHLINNLKERASNQGLVLGTVGLYGCEVTEQISNKIFNDTGIKVLTLPHYDNSILTLTSCSDPSKRVWSYSTQNQFTGQRECLIDTNPMCNIEDYIQ